MANKTDYREVTVCRNDLCTVDCTVGLVTGRDDHGAGVDSGRNLHFRPEQEPESIF